MHVKSRVAIGLHFLVLLASAASANANALVNQNFGGPLDPNRIGNLPTSSAALVGRFANGPINLPLRVNAADFSTTYGSGQSSAWPAEVQALQYFANGGGFLWVVRVQNFGNLADALVGSQASFTGVYALTAISNIRLVFAPELTLSPSGSFPGAFAAFRSFLEQRHIVFLLDPPPALPGAAAMVNWVSQNIPNDATCCATYFPYLIVGGSNAPASGTMAGICVQNDANYGIWHSPSGPGFTVSAQGLWPTLDAGDYSLLASNHINSFQSFPGIGIVPWGGRTLNLQSDVLSYLSVVRLRYWIEDSLQQGLAWAAFEPDDAPTWVSIKAECNGFLNQLLSQGAFAGSAPAYAYFVKCGLGETMTDNDVVNNRVIVECGLAYLAPANFDIIRLLIQPAPPTSALATINALSFNGLMYLAHPTTAGLTYRLETTSSLSSGAWSNLYQPRLVGDGTWQNQSFPISGNQAFFRLNIANVRQTFAPATMEYIPEGSSVMGDTIDNELDALPLHTNVVSAFFIDTNVVNFSLWNQVSQWAASHGYSFDNPGLGKSASHPVQSVNWYDCAKWCNARSEMEGRGPAYYTDATLTQVYRAGDLDMSNACVRWDHGYRLPTEAEFEKAARGGAVGNRFPWSDADTISWSRANYATTSPGYYSYDLNTTAGWDPAYNDGIVPYTSPSGILPGNDFGLCDMAGNVSEWCWDRYGAYTNTLLSDPHGTDSGSYRVQRGGSWNDPAPNCSVAHRVSSGPGQSAQTVGFRTVLPQTQP